MSDNVYKFFAGVVGRSQDERAGREKRATRKARALNFLTSDKWHVHKWRICRGKDGWIITDSMMISNLWRCEDCGEQKWASSIAHSDSFPVLVRGADGTYST